MSKDVSKLSLIDPDQLKEVLMKLVDDDNLRQKGFGYDVVSIW